MIVNARHDAAVARAPSEVRGTGGAVSVQAPLRYRPPGGREESPRSVVQAATEQHEYLDVGHARQVLPDPAEGLLVATVRLDEQVGAGAALSALRPAIRRRHTSRELFTEQEIPEAVWRELREAAGAEGADLGIPDAWHTQLILELVQDAEGRDSLEPANSEEMEGWIRTGPDASLSADGVPEYAFGPFRHDGRAPVRDFAGRHRVADRPAATFENAPRLVLLSTAEDGPADWLRAGQAMERVLLVATSHGLATSLTSHALEHPDLRWNMRDPLTAMGHVQMVLRLGYGPGGVRSPRRPVGEVLDFA